MAFLFAEDPALYRRVSGGGSNNASDKTVIQLNCLQDACARSYGGSIRFVASARFAPSVTQENELTGKCYECLTGGTIEAGADFFPGAQAGTVESLTYSWYK